MSHLDSFTFSKGTLGKAEEAVKAGLVTRRDQGNSVQDWAVVSMSDPKAMRVYWVHLSADLTDAACSCPNGQAKYLPECWHLAAVLMRVKEERGARGE